MSRRARPARVAALVLALLLSVLANGCLGYIPFTERPAAGYVAGSGQPLTIAVVDEAGGEWSPALARALRLYGEAAPRLRFDGIPGRANITIVVRRYVDTSPPPIDGYRFPFGAGGFAAVYDGDGDACNYPPSPLPLNCDGAIAYVEIYLNDAIPPGADIEARRLRLVIHELGHALGLTRHDATLNVEALSARYGWD